MNCHFFKHMLLILLVATKPRVACHDCDGLSPGDPRRNLSHASSFPAPVEPGVGVDQRQTAAQQTASAVCSTTAGQRAMPVMCRPIPKGEQYRDRRVINQNAEEQT